MNASGEPHPESTLTTRSMSDINKLLIVDYLESLKEDKELDAIFPTVLDIAGYEIISTPKDSKGQSQYGRDVIAIKEVDGVMTRFYFELKGGSDRNITDQVLTKNDGVIASIRASKFTSYTNSAIPGFNDFPIKYVLVHNGTLKENARPTLEGFIETEKLQGQFERWDISKLATLFSDNLFNEYLLTDDDGNVALFKKTLVLLDVPEYDLTHLHQLVQKLCEKTKPHNERYVQKFLSSLSLIGVMIYHYCKAFNDLDKAKASIDFIVLKSWSWILENNLEEKPFVKTGFHTIMVTQLIIYHDYLGKTGPIARSPDGLFQERGGPYEEVAYSIRCSDFLNMMIYSFRLDEYFDPAQDTKTLIELLIEVVNNNLSGLPRPLLDNQGVAYLNVFIYLQEKSDVLDTNEFQKRFLDSLFENICIIKNVKKRLPELHSRKPVLIEYIATAERPFNYDDASSTLILMLFEITIILDAPDIYNRYRDYFTNTKVDLQTFHPMKDKKTELRLFNKEITDEGWSDTSIKLPEKYTDFVEIVKKSHCDTFAYRTDAAGYGHLKYLAHGFYKTPFFPIDWRCFIKD